MVHLSRRAGGGTWGAVRLRPRARRSHWLEEEQCVPCPGSSARVVRGLWHRHRVEGQLPEPARRLDIWLRRARLTQQERAHRNEELHYTDLRPLPTTVREGPAQLPAS